MGSDKSFSEDQQAESFSLQKRLFVIFLEEEELFKFCRQAVMTLGQGLVVGFLQGLRGSPPERKHNSRSNDKAAKIEDLQAAQIFEGDTYAVTGRVLSCQQAIVQDCLGSQLDSFSAYNFYSSCV
ncbi:hypothetical protein SUGI_0989480 [Cryptomeria japonica]|nr:hypothetical protein SUGI_0989480 [Cryptomeria japonica]